MTICCAVVPAAQTGVGHGAPGVTERTAPPPITVSGDQIVRDGQTWWLLGYNSFVWSGNCGHDYEKMSDAQVEQWFASMRHDGHGAARLFFYDGWNYDRLDTTIATAKKYDIYLILTLDDAIGGCGENDKTDAWFDDQSERTTYRNHMTTLLERYRGETTIAWFEYFNEPRWRGGALLEFINEMGAIAEQVDPDRLWSTGTQPPYALDGNANYRTLNASPHVDIASLHEYDENEIETNHGAASLAHSAGKPMMVGEFGLKGATGGCRSFTERARIVAQKADVYTDTDRGYAGALAWAWQPGNADACRYENLTDDEATQEALRTTRSGSVTNEIR